LRAPVTGLLSNDGVPRADRARLDGAIASALVSEAVTAAAAPRCAHCHPRDQTLRMAAQFGQLVHNLLRYQATFGSATLRDAFRRIDLGECLRTITRDVASCGTQAWVRRAPRRKCPPVASDPTVSRQIDTLAAHAPAALAVIAVPAVLFGGLRTSRRPVEGPGAVTFGSGTASRCAGSAAAPLPGAVTRP
jgi:hypothetical protein